ncbi:M57 family metalloprotease [Flaviaesturariibacter aridisoli]|uniref:Dual-action HEIGH metallo-peptidase n=1 Tax=Flaviaesturariibacter aridisoli TaxID=2545761 RepID=A0A4R4E8P0_9BACT|nr:M57 family metalloprotease [Flaviaesturariibacter aridisoli]TCZ74135.1 hypothetical protein E0486_03405 [Flaviaesturariibacter aridisoli]
MSNALFTKPSALAFVAFLTFAATSCSKKDVAAPAPVQTEAAAAPAESISAAEVDELTTFIRSTTGEEHVTFDAATRNFVIAGDAAMSLDEARSHKESRTVGAQTEHRKAYYVVARNKANVIKVYADATVPAVWLTALDRAIANWNASGSYLRVSRVTTYATGTLKVTAVNNGATGVIATTYYPDYSGNVGRSCTINTNYNYLSSGQQTFAITHELGHAFGFGHTNSTYGTLVTGTPNTDGSSVMNSVCLTWSAFTTYDKLAIKTVYPL